MKRSSQLTVCGSRLFFFLLLLICSVTYAVEPQIPSELRPWLQPQEWVRPSSDPVIQLGTAGEFDDMHIFAPCVVQDERQFRLFYCGSRGKVEQRVFDLGMALSTDGNRFRKVDSNPVFTFGDGKHSILTPTIIRDGQRWRMWFAATDFVNGKGLHTLHESTSDDLVHWSPPSKALLSNLYAPTVMKIGRTYRMWFTRVGPGPWVICHATSYDGTEWKVTPKPVLEVDQAWELDRLFYPTVVRQDGAYVMWYGSYWKDAKPAQKTALGFAASLDGLKWYKHPANPVFRPEPKNAWESHYVTSESVMRTPDGGWRIWYASRTKPPFDHKYFAIGTATWRGPELKQSVEKSASVFNPQERTAFLAAQSQWRERLKTQLGIPQQLVPLDSEHRGDIPLDDVTIEKWIYTSESGSRVPALVYRPTQSRGRSPAIVITYGHGGSKSTWEHQYAGQLYAKLGLVCLAIDPIGEEERNLRGGLGTRAHDGAEADAKAAKAGRLIMGKLVFDAMRGIDFLQQRSDVDPARIGVAGYSLGGATGTWATMLDPRIKLSLVCGWAFDDITLRTKLCTRVPNLLLREQLTWGDFVSLAAPHCAMLVMNGDADTVIDLDKDQSAWKGTNRAVGHLEAVNAILAASGKSQTWYEPRAGHRPFFIYKEALAWLEQNLDTPRYSLVEINALPTVNAGTWLDAQQVSLEKLYGTPLHWRGATLPDVGVKYLPREQLAVLTTSEAGTSYFTLEGWLAAIEKKSE